jgi:hypothetical protein
MAINVKKFRIQLTEQEVWQLRNLLVKSYLDERKNILWKKRRIKAGEPDSRIYPIELQQKHLVTSRHLLKKLSRRLGVKWFKY